MFSNLNAIAVDDEIINVRMVEELSNKIGLKVKGFLSSIKALEYLKNNVIDIIFVDYLMPDLDGIEFIKKAKEIHSDALIIMITSIANNNKLKLDAIKAGAAEFISKPFRWPEFTARVNNLAQLSLQQQLLKDKTKLLKKEVDKATSLIVERETEALNVIGKAAEYRDPETSSHLTRVSEYSKIIAKELGEDEKVQELIYRTSPLHDVGKLGIPDSILLKPGKLNNDEFEIIKKHSEIGCEILTGNKSIYLQTGAVIALTHHEKYNGRGYPRGLKEDNIPLFGRIVALVDVFDALTSKRPYKEEWPMEKAVELIESEKGKHFDPKIVNAFLGNLDLIKEIHTNVRE